MPDENTAKPKVVALELDGELEFHLPATAGVPYATACGLDGGEDLTDDMETGPEGQRMGKVPRGQKINCPRCTELWQLARKYRASDFQNPV